VLTEHYASLKKSPNDIYFFLVKNYKLLGLYTFAIFTCFILYNMYYDKPLNFHILYDIFQHRNIAVIIENRIL